MACIPKNKKTTYWIKNIIRNRFIRYFQGGDDMKNLIFSQDNSIESEGAIGIQTCGIIFWQKTGFLRHQSLEKLKEYIECYEIKSI